MPTADSTTLSNTARTGATLPVALDVISQGPSVPSVLEVPDGAWPPADLLASGATPRGPSSFDEELWLLFMAIMTYSNKRLGQVFDDMAELSREHLGDLSDFVTQAKLQLASLKFKAETDARDTIFGIFDTIFDQLAKTIESTIQSMGPR